MTKILLYSQESASDYYRGYLPYLHLRSKLAKMGVELFRSNKIRMEEQYDVYMFQRIINPAAFPALFKLKERGAKIVWDLDDDFWNIPEWSPAVAESWQIDCLETCLQKADYITTTTLPLKEAISDRIGGKPPVVLPNLIDCEPYYKTTESFYNDPTDFGYEDQEPIRVFWGGSATHEGDLKQIESAIFKSNQDKSINIEFIFAGYMPEYFMKYPNCISLGAWNVRYHAAALRLIAPHFGLAPLCNHVFNQSKSNIKYLEMVMAGAIPICSNFGPYAKAYGVKIDYTEDHNPRWYDAISKISKAESYVRSEIYNICYNDVRSNHSWQSESAPRPWLDFFAQFA